MLTRRFTSTWRRARRRDPVERLTVTIAGRSCGVRPIAIASENSSASMNGRCSSDVDDEDRHRQHARDADEEQRESPQPDLERGLGRALAEPDRDASECCVRAGAHDDARSRHLAGRSCPSARTTDVVATASGDFSTGSDSPVSTASSHSSSVESSSRMSAGTMSPIEICTMSPGTRSMTSTRCGTPSRTTSAWWRICECSAATACSDRYSFTKPRPTESADDHADDHGVGVVSR